MQTSICHLPKVSKSQEIICLNSSLLLEVSFGIGQYIFTQNKNYSNNGCITVSIGVLHINPVLVFCILVFFIILALVPNYRQVECRFGLPGMWDQTHLGYQGTTVVVKKVCKQLKLQFVDRSVETTLGRLSVNVKRSNRLMVSTDWANKGKDFP